MNVLTNYAVSPGEYLDEWIEDNYLTVEKIAEESGLTVDELNDFLSDDPSPMTINLAVSLFEVTGIRVEHWLNLEFVYRKDLERLNNLTKVHLSTVDYSI